VSCIKDFGSNLIIYWSSSLGFWSRKMTDNQNLSLSDVAYTSLKKKIIGLNGGTYISARQFAHEIGISYTPVREALLRLQKEGMLKLVPNVGFFVETLDIADLIEIFQVRECIEVFVLDKVFDRITKEHIALMKKINKQQEEALSRRDILNYQRLDIKLHEITFSIYGNKFLKNFYHNIREQYMVCSKKIARAHSNDAILEHTEFFSYLETGNKEKAICALNKHIIHVKERMTEGYINVINE
jgi:DNA-binding GntR family transcriptional regulator